MNQRLHFALVPFLVLFALTAANGGSVWRAPRPDDLGRGSEWRAKDVNRYLLVRGDFDGDGREDVARLLINDEDDEIGFFVTMGASKAPALLLETIRDRRMLEVLGIGLARPGTYATACGKGYWKCDKGEPPRARLENPGIDFFAHGKGNSFFIWNGKAKKFDEVLMSD